MKNENINYYWLKFNEYTNLLSKELGRSKNIVGEYAEYLAHKYYGGELLKVSKASADIKADNGKLYQVKSRKLEKIKSTQLGIIRSWKFDFLVVIIFGAKGEILKAIEVPVEIAKEYAKENKHQNGWVITTNNKFLTDGRGKDILKKLS